MALVSAIMACLKFTKIWWQLFNHVDGTKKQKYLNSIHISVETWARATDRNKAVI